MTIRFNQKKNPILKLIASGGTTDHVNKKCTASEKENKYTLLYSLQ